MARACWASSPSTPIPARLSAAFVWDLLLRLTAARLPALRWPVGGLAALWSSGWRRAPGSWASGSKTSSRVDVLPEPPVIVATQLELARALLGDDGPWPGRAGGACCSTWGSRDPGEGGAATRSSSSTSTTPGFVERATGVDESLAPAGHALVQADMPLKLGEARDVAARPPRAPARPRLPAMARKRVVWRRTGFAAGRTGALDLPGSTWRDRPAIDRGGGVFLAGDLVAAPGVRAEISINSALHAARLATTVLSTPVRRDSQDVH